VSFAVGDKLGLLSLAADPSGSAGDAYWNTVLNAIRVYNGSSWLTAGVASPGLLDTEHVLGAAGEPAFQGAWVHNSGTQQVKFRKDPFGRVRLGGAAKTGTSGTVMFTLPAGYRPAFSGNFIVSASGGPALVAIDASTGNVTPTNIGSSAVATFVFVEGIEFDTDAATSFAVTSGVPEVTSLPGSPYDGQMVDLLVDSAGTYGGPFLWRCKYRLASPSPHRWHIIGDAPPVGIEGSGSYGSITTTAYASLGMPSLQLPNAGVYMVEVWSQQALILNAANAYGRLSYKIGAAAAVDADAAVAYGTATNATISYMRQKTIATAALLQLQANASAGNFYPNGNNLVPLGIRAYPVRIS
jgi:hypothetical protein